MVYIYKKTIGNKEYYYLRASERRGNRVINKDLAYLGSNIEEVKKALEKLPKHKERIRKAYKTIHNFLESNRFIEEVKKLKLKQDMFLGDKLIDIEACKLHYIKEFQKLDSLTKQEILKNFLIEFAYNTTSIEGNTINLQEAKKLLEEGKTPKNKTLREIYDLQNTEKVFFDLIESKSKDEITNEFIINIHKKLLYNIESFEKPQNSKLSKKDFDAISFGNRGYSKSSIDNRIGYRSQDVRVIKANFKSTPAPYVKTDMDLLIKWYNENKDKFHTFVLGQIFHHKFEKIHPFMDGNGRTGRMILNYILIKNNYPPLIIRNKNRQKYLKAIRKADNSDLLKVRIEDYSELIQFVADEMIDGYWSIFL